MKITLEKYFDDYDALMEVFGELDRNRLLIEQAFGVGVYSVNGAIRVNGEREDADDALKTIDELYIAAIKGGLTPELVAAAIDIRKNGGGSLSELTDSAIGVYKGRVVRPKTLGQKKYVDAIMNNSVVFGVGPAGTGKTYLAVALAVAALKNRDTERIILTRPAVEAGEKLGFLPGDLSEKVDPYLRPLFDALKDTMGEAYVKHIENGTIEIAPLAYMRGRTLSKSFIILDEAQNTTKEQMKMFLTRMGENSKIVVTGDVTQIDLPHSVASGLKHVTRVLDGIKGIEIVKLTGKDVVRHPLVTEIIRAYERAESADNADNFADGTNKRTSAGADKEDNPSE